MNSPGEPLVWDASFPVLRLTGGGTRQFLHGQTTAAMLAAPEHTLIRSCWLTATGRLLALLEIQLDAEGADVLVLCGDADIVMNGFERVIFPADRVRLQGPSARRRLQRLDSSAASPRWNEDVIWPETSSPTPSWTAARQATSEELAHWRIAQGLPCSPHELNGDTNPLELGLSRWINLDKGCYLGQETLAKLVSRDGVKQKLRYWTCRDCNANAAPVRPGMVLMAEGSRAGVITSVARTESGWHGLALVRRACLGRDNLDVEDLSDQLLISSPASFEDWPDS